MTKWKMVLAFTAIFLALLLGPTSAQAPGETSSGEMLMGYEAGIILITAPTNIADWSLTPGQDNIAEGSLWVTAIDTGWSVSVSDANSMTGGRMTNYSNGQYDSSTKLGACMGVNATGIRSSGSCVTLDAGGEIAHGPIISVAERIPIIFNQTVSWSDPVSAPGCVYRIVVTFTASSW